MEIRTTWIRDEKGKHRVMIKQSGNYVSVDIFDENRNVIHSCLSVDEVIEKEERRRRDEDRRFGRNRIRGRL